MAFQSAKGAELILKLKGQYHKLVDPFFPYDQSKTILLNFSISQRFSQHLFVNVVYWMVSKLLNLCYFWKIKFIGKSSQKGTLNIVRKLHVCVVIDMFAWSCDFSDNLPWYLNTRTRRWLREPTLKFLKASHWLYTVGTIRGETRLIYIYHSSNFNGLKYGVT